jgi:hypothetical protein
MAAAIDRDAPARPALLYLAMNWNRNPAPELAEADFILRPELLAQVRASERDRVRADIVRFKLTRLLDLGLLKDALAFADSLPPNLLKQALTAKNGEIRTIIGGFALQTSTYGEDLAPDYAAALALDGRPAEARAALDVVASAPKLKGIRACLDAGTKEDCGVGVRGIPVGALVVDQLLDDPKGDPYVLVEAMTSGHSGEGGGVAEALCRLLSPSDDQDMCVRSRESVAANRDPGAKIDADDAAFWAAVARAGGAQFESDRARYAAALAALGPVKIDKSDGSRSTVDPAPVPFRELPLPAAAKAGPKSDPKTFAPLPAGYSLVRAERSGQRVAAISLSQRFDPNGEVTQGGYWLHLSDDGGKSWQAPLYTGLADHFPYVVPRQSRVPMIAGEAIHLEVEEALIDTASIFYPPVATTVRRKRSGIYLDIPIAVLRKDSDGARPFIVGSDRNCSGPPNAETLARLEILKTLFKIEARAIIEPIDAKGVHIGQWGKSNPTEEAPIFLHGDPADYRCVTIDRPMLVYRKEDVERLRKFSPDFQLIELPRIRWNRDRSRGFVNWNMGWAGGTYRLTRKGGGWTLTSLSEWVS